MRISNDEFTSINFKDFHRLRTILFQYFYPRNDVISILTGIIAKNIECINIEYDSYSYTFTLKVKKTEMKKPSRPRFVHCPVYYNKYISSIYHEFLSAISGELSQLFSAMRKTDPTDDMNVSKFLAEPESLCNLCIVTCMSDNIVMIKL